MLNLDIDDQPVSISLKALIWGTNSNKWPSIEFSATNCHFLEINQLAISWKCPRGNFQFQCWEIFTRGKTKHFIASKSELYPNLLPSAAAPLLFLLPFSQLCFELSSASHQILRTLGNIVTSSTRDFWLYKDGLTSACFGYHRKFLWFVQKFLWYSGKHRFTIDGQ